MHSKIRSASVRLAAAGLATAALAVLAGCGVKADTPETNYNNPVTLQGQVFAGRNYMPGATVNVYITQPTGVATNGIYVGTAKLLATTTTNATGGWSLTGLSCSSPDQLYVTAVAGTPYPSGQNSTTLANNPNSVMMTAIGDCSILANTDNERNVTSIVTNEASTVAAVWALRPFISLSGTNDTTVNVTSDATNYGGTSGVGVAGNYAGLAHAFLNANLLSPYKIGNFVQYTSNAADNTGGGLVPVQELNSLAYVQYLCTIGGPSGNAGDFSYCSQLYTLATPPNGTAPTNSLQAMLDIADNPANNAANILAFSLTPIPLSGQTTSQVINAGVYVPALSGFGDATDWSVEIDYYGGFGATSSGQGITVPYYVGLDADDDVFVTNPNASTGTAGNIVALTSNGTSLWSSATSSTLNQPINVAADQFGNVWVINSSSSVASSFVEQINGATGAVVQQYPSTAASLRGITVDSLGNVWYTSTATTGQNLFELVRNGTTYSQATFAVPPISTYPLYQIRADANNNIWIGGKSSTAAAVVFLPNTGTASAPTYTAGLVYSPLAGAETSSSLGNITLDANGNAYTVTDGASGGVFKTSVSQSGGVSILTSTNIGTNPAYASLSTASVGFLDTDGAGVLWIPEISTETDLYQFIPPVGTSTTATSNGYYPCRNAGTTGGTTCTESFSTKYDIAIDSTGSVWVPTYGSSFLGHVEQVIGIAAPAVPLKSLGKFGVMP